MVFRTNAGRRLEAEHVAQLIGKYSAFPGAVLYNSLKEDRDKEAVTWIYLEKRRQGEFPEEIREDTLKCIEETARNYIAQKCAFSDVLVKEGFDVVSEALKDYEGRIATLSNHGTLCVFSKPSLITQPGKHHIYRRKITMKRIHSPKYSRDGARGYLDDDLKLGGSVHFVGEDSGSYNSLYLRGIAINPNGASDDNLEVRAANTIIAHVETDTSRHLHISKEDLLERHTQSVMRLK